MKPLARVRALIAYFKNGGNNSNLELCKLFDCSGFTVTRARKISGVRSVKLSVPVYQMVDLKLHGFTYEVIAALYNVSQGYVRSNIIDITGPVYNPRVVTAKNILSMKW